MVARTLNYFLFISKQPHGAEEQLCRFKGVFATGVAIEESITDNMVSSSLLRRVSAAWSVHPVVNHEFQWKAVLICNRSHFFLPSSSPWASQDGKSQNLFLASICNLEFVSSKPLGITSQIKPKRKMRMPPVNSTLHIRSHDPTSTLSRKKHGKTTNNNSTFERFLTQKKLT